MDEGARKHSFQARGRANANRRLIHAFGIDNAFTKERSKRHGDYMKQVGALLRPNWSLVAGAAKELAQSYQHLQSLVRLVQTFVLTMTINVLFQRDISALDEESVSCVAAEINRIWILSKTSREVIPWTEQHELHKALLRLILDCDPLDPQTNALNLILPGFETMWRVVLRRFIEVRYRSAQESEKWVTALMVYAGEPGTHQVRHIFSLSIYFISFCNNLNIERRSNASARPCARWTSGDRQHCRPLVSDQQTWERSTVTKKSLEPKKVQTNKSPEPKKGSKNKKKLFFLVVRTCSLTVLCFFFYLVLFFSALSKLSLTRR